jgi:hypothetical protein
MKKLIASAVVLLGSLSTFTATAQGQQTARKLADKTVFKTDGYTEIKAEEVPAVVMAAFKKSFPETKLSKAYINEKKEYKLEVQIGDKVGSLFIDGKGKWLKK